MILVVCCEGKYVLDEADLIGAKLLTVKTPTEKSNIHCDRSFATQTISQSATCASLSITSKSGNSGLNNPGQIQLQSKDFNTM